MNEDLNIKLTSLRVTNVFLYVNGYSNNQIIEKSLWLKRGLGEDVTIISSAEETAIELSTILQHKGILSDNLNPKHRFFTTGSILSFEHIAERWLGYQISVEGVNLPMEKQIVK